VHASLQMLGFACSMTTTHSSFDPSSRFTKRPSAYFTYSWTRTHCKTMVLDISHATLAYSVLENFQGLELRGRGQGQGLENWSSRILEDKDFPRGQQQCRPKTFSFVHTKF